MSAKDVKSQNSKATKPNVINPNVGKRQEKADITRQATMGERNYTLYATYYGLKGINRKYNCESYGVSVRVNLINRDNILSARHVRLNGGSLMSLPVSCKIDMKFKDNSKDAQIEALYSKEDNAWKVVSGHSIDGSKISESVVIKSSTAKTVNSARHHFAAFVNEALSYLSNEFEAQTTAVVSPKISLKKLQAQRMLVEIEIDEANERIEALKKASKPVDKMNLKLTSLNNRIAKIDEAIKAYNPK